MTDSFKDGFRAGQADKAAGISNDSIAASPAYLDGYRAGLRYKGATPQVIAIQGMTPLGIKQRDNPT